MFKYAIVRKPGSNFSEGLTTSDLGTPDFKKTLKQHDSYCKALIKCGLKLIVLDADMKFPDGTFVEDTAVVTERCAIITRPGNITRLGEQDKIKDVLSQYKTIEEIESLGTVDAGDILKIDGHFYIGLSERTNTEGARQLAFILSKHGYSSTNVPVKTVLHLKTGVTYIENNNILSIGEFADIDIFKKFNVIKIDKNESYSANCLLINGFLLMPKGFPETKKKLQSLGYNILEIEMSEFQKMDGGLTCLSLLF